MRGCNCLPEWKVTDNGTGQPYAGLGGNCSHTDNTSVPWCLVLRGHLRRRALPPRRRRGVGHLRGQRCARSGSTTSVPMSRCCSGRMRRGGTPTLPRRLSAGGAWERPTTLPAGGVLPSKRCWCLVSDVPGGSPFSDCLRCRGHGYGEPPAPMTTVAVAGLAPGAGNAVLAGHPAHGSAGPWTPAATNSLEANMFLHLQAGLPAEPL